MFHKIIRYCSQPAGRTKLGSILERQLTASAKELEAEFSRISQALEDTNTLLRTSLVSEHIPFTYTYTDCQLFTYTGGASEPGSEPGEMWI